MSIMKIFKDAARQASFHYADDSGREWSLARKEAGICNKLYRENPEMREDMLRAMKGELWYGQFLSDTVDRVWVESQADREQAIADLKAEVEACDVTVRDGWPDSRTLSRLHLLGEMDWVNAWADVARARRREAKMAAAAAARAAQ